MEVAPRIVGDTEVCEQLRASNARDFGLGEQLAYMEELQRIAEMEELVERERRQTCWPGNGWRMSRSLIISR